MISRAYNMLVASGLVSSLSMKVKVAQSYPTLGDPIYYTVHGILQDRILEWVAFPFSRGYSQPRDWTQVSCIPGRFFYQLSHQGSSRILDWVAYLFSSRSSWPRNQTGVSCIAGRFFTSWATREAPSLSMSPIKSGHPIWDPLFCMWSIQFLTPLS